MQPPNKTFRSASMYQGLIDARISNKENSVRKDDANSHFFSARVRYALELAAKFPAMAMIYSVDNKNKIKLGSQVAAVDRRIQINRFFPAMDKPNLSDHDFPTPGYYIVPCGYLKLDPISPSSLTVDHLGRQQFE